MRRTTAAFVVAAALLVAGCSSGSKKQASAPMPPPAPSAPQSAAPSTTTTRAVLTGDGAFMTAPASPTTKPYDPSPQCQTLIDPGFTGLCTQATTPSGTIAVVSEQQGHGPPDTQNGGETRELLYHRDGDTFTLALRYSGQVSQDSGLLDSSTLVDVAADGDHKAVFVLRDPSDDTGATTATVRAVDVAEATGKVVLHLSLDHGVARQATGGGVEAWTRRTGTAPLQYRHFVVRYHEGAWRTEVDETVRAEDVPRPDAKSSPGF